MQQHDLVSSLVWYTGLIPTYTHWQCWYRLLVRKADHALSVHAIIRWQSKALTAEYLGSDAYCILTVTPQIKSSAYTLMQAQSTVLHHTCWANTCVVQQQVVMQQRQSQGIHQIYICPKLFLSTASSINR